MVPPPDLASLATVEKDVMITALLRRFDDLSARVAALEAENTALRAENLKLREKQRLPPKTPDNSSKPPSQGQKGSGGEGKPRPKRKAHRGAHRSLHPNPQSRFDLGCDRFPCCQAYVSGGAQLPVQAYDRIEIPPITPDVTRVTLRGGTCPSCATRFKASPPAGMEPGSPFGPNLRAFVLYLRFAQGIPFERLARLLSDLLGLAISEGALANILADSAPALALQAEQIRQRLLSGSILASDETSARVGKQTWWTWVFHHADSACFVIRPSRGKDVVAAFLGEARPAFWVSDRLAAQMGYATDAHQVCLAHLLRDAQYAVDAGDPGFAPAIKALLGQATAIGRRRDGLADATLRTYAAKLDSRLDRLLRLSPSHDEGLKFQRVIKKYRQHLFIFVTRRDITATNNGSEQALRPCVIFRKITNCFRSEWGAALYADVRSVLETARRRGIPILQAIRLTVDASALPVAA